MMAEGAAGGPLRVEAQTVGEGELCTALETGGEQIPPLAVRIDSTYWVRPAPADTAEPTGTDRETLVAEVAYLNRTEESVATAPVGAWFYAARGTGERVRARSATRGGAPTLAPGDSTSRQVRFRLDRTPYRLVVSLTGDPGGDACRFAVDPTT